MKKFTKRRTYKKRQVKKPIVPKSVKVVPDGYRLLNRLKPRIMQFKRSITNFNIPQIASLSNPVGTLVFKLSDLPSVTEFTNLFDKYRITNVKLTYRLQDAPLDGSIFPTIYSWKNYDVALSVGNITLSQVQQTPNVHVLQTSPDSRQMSHSIKPYLIMSTFNSGFTQKNNLWIDMNYSASAQYYGIAYYIENLVGTDSQQIKLVYDLEYTIQCMVQF